MDKIIYLIKRDTFAKKKKQISEGKEGRCMNQSGWCNNGRSLVDLLLALGGLDVSSGSRGGGGRVVAIEDDLEGDDEVEDETENGGKKDDRVIDFLQRRKDSRRSTCRRQKEGDNRELSSWLVFKVGDDLGHLRSDKDSNRGGLKNRHHLRRHLSWDHRSQWCHPQCERRDRYHTNLSRVVQHKRDNNSRLSQQEECLSPGRERVLARHIVAQSDRESNQIEDKHGKRDTSSRASTNDAHDLRQLDSHRS